jgi:hypothetical protein
MVVTSGYFAAVSYRHVVNRLKVGFRVYHKNYFVHPILHFY